MEISIYSDFDCKRNNKALYRCRVECLDSFSFEKSLDVFRSIYGAKVIIVFVCV